MNRLSAVLVMTALLAGPVGSAAVEAEWVPRWRDDLEFARTRFPQVHAGLFHTLSREEFEARLDSIGARVPELSHHAIVVELARLVATVGDGHTRVTLPLAEGIGFPQGHSETEPSSVLGLVFHQYPLRLHHFPDGLRVIAIDRPHGHHVGERVVRVGHMAVEEAMAAVAEIVHRDNPMGVERWLPRYMVLAEMLEALGVIESVRRAPWVLVDDAGHETTLRLEPVRDGVSPSWIVARDASRKASPLWLREPENFWWYERLQGGRTIYFQYNRVANKENETLAAFARGMFDAIEREPVERLVVDLRNNDGGDGSLNQPLLHGIIRSSKLRRPGTLFAIIGRETFSAAMMFAVDLEKHTPVLFVGEPTGASPNDYGDSRKLRLPNSGITVRLSTLYWQMSSPTDRREAMEPQFPAPLTYEDFRTNRDPALDLVLSIEPNTDSELAGAWRGVFVPNPGAVYPLRVALARSDEGWAATLDVEGTDLANVPLENVRVAPGTIAFVWNHPQERIVIDGSVVRDRLAEARLIGSADMGGRRGLVLLEKTP